MQTTQWARLQQDVDCGLRRGAWYPTVVLGWTRVLLDVHGKRRSVPFHYLEIVENRPDYWTVVRRAGNATLIPERWAKGYVVCPSCSYRQLPIGRPAKLRCDHCQEVHEVAWDKPYLGVVSNDN